MALSSIVCRGSGSMFRAAIRSVASRRAFHREILCYENSRPLTSDSAEESTVVDNHETLVRLLQSKIDWTEQLRHVESQVIPDGFPFEIKDNPGEAKIFLTRKYQNELIKVEVDRRSIEDNAKESNVQPRLRMSVHISKGDGPYVMYGVNAFPGRICFDYTYIDNPYTVSHPGPNFKDEQLETNSRSGDEVGKPVPPLLRFSTATFEKPTGYPDATLVRLLESEISKVILDDFPYEISDKIVDNNEWRPLWLKRKFRDEIIKISVWWPDNHSYTKNKNKDKDKNNTEHEDTQNDEPSFKMTVGVSKGDGLTLEFDLAATRTKISICSWSMRYFIYGNGDKDEDESLNFDFDSMYNEVYEGPNFDLLNDNLKMALYKYLEIREIKPGCCLTNFLLDHIRAEEYITHRNLPWLKSLKQFVEK